MKGYCPKCRQRGHLNYATLLHTKRPKKYYTCTNPKCNLTWSETT